ncbi:MAG: hypothetical protein NC086_11800 [Alistipes sp.]|nr:hypothetical protein [Alistipes sp.]
MPNYCREQLKIRGKYEDDFWVYAFASEMQFNRDILIVKGHTVKNETIKFKDYEWERMAPMV